MAAQDLMFNANLPDILYKYRPLDATGYTLRLLSDGQLYFSRADSFNDPFDSAITYVYDNIHTPIADNWIAAAVNREMPHLSDSQKQAFAARRMLELRTNPTEVEEQRKSQVEASYQAFGIYSLALRRDDILMWSHYAEKHTGVCVGLDVRHIWQTAQRLMASNDYMDLLPVAYAHEMPRVDFFRAMLADSSGEVLRFITTKFIDWAYEHECRLIHKDHVDEVFDFGKDIVRQVLLGCRMSEDNRNKVIAHCRENIPQAELFIMKPEPEMFRLISVPA
jgi:hypothetical protein